MHPELKKVIDWIPPKHWKRISTLDVHTGGEPLRVVLSGFPEPQGQTILEKRRWIKEHADRFRQAIMWEPRGHADMYGALITCPEHDDADFGIIFMHNEGYSTMCGHGIIAATKAVLQTGMFPMDEPETVLKIDSPAGRVTAMASIENGKVGRVAFDNVPSFVVGLDLHVEVPDVGKVAYDLAFGGAYYAYVQAEPLGLNLTLKNLRQLIDVGMKIKHAVMNSVEILHPKNENLSFLYGTIFIGKPFSKTANSQNVCIFADGEVDRSPTGTGVSGRMAIYHARGELRPGEKMAIESIIGSRFNVSIVEEVSYGPYRAVIPRVEGTAFVSGKNEWYLDPEDELRTGFFIR